MSTPHNSAEKNQIAKSVLMPGDPLRAKFIADNFLDNPVLVNNVRGVQGYTGTWKGKPVTVMASGMGMPSIGIYSYELYNFYGVENIIRIGSAGSYDESLRVFDTVLVSTAVSESNYAKVAFGYRAHAMKPSKALNTKLSKAALKLGIPLTEACIHSSDVFYGENKEHWKEMRMKYNCMCVEMESFALFANAKALGKKAACLLTISDSFVASEITTAEERQSSFHNMMKIALELAGK